MRTIDRATSFKRDYKREAKGPHRATLDSELKSVVVVLASDQPLDARYRDHDLSGDWAGYRECHVKPDLLLISASRMPIRSDWRGLAHTASFSADLPGWGSF